MMNRQYGALSGIAIFLVVLSHVVQFGLEIAPITGIGRYVLAIPQVLGVYAVPVFLFVSGAFLAYSARELSLTFVKNSLARIVWPYVIWSGIFYILLYLLVGERSSPAGYLKNLIVGYPYHFVPLLVFWYAASPALIWLGRRYPAWMLIGFAALQVWFLAVRYPGLLGPLPRWTAPPVLFIPMSDWGIYFPLGLVMALHPAWKPRLLRWRPVSAVATILLLVLGLASVYSLVGARWIRFVSPVPLMFLLPTIERSWIPLFGRFERLGRRSYGVYLAHFVIINALAAAIGAWLPWLSRAPLMVYILLFVGTLGLSVLLMDATARTVVGRRGYRYFFGIVPPPLAAGS